MDPRPFLSGLRRRLWTVLITDGLARTCAWGVLVIAGAILLDRLAILLDPLQPLPASVRLPLLVGVLAVIATVAWRRLVRPLRRSYDHLTLARIAERRIPEFDGRLLSAVEGIDLGERDRRRLGELCAGARLQRILRMDGMARAATGAALLLLAAGGLALAQPGLVGTGLQRLFVPFGNAEWQREHDLRAELEERVVPEDQPLVVVADGEGTSARLRLEYRGDHGLRDARIPEALTGPWRERLKLPVGGYRIRLTWGDSLPVELDGRVVRRPGLVEAEARITPPDYIDGEVETIDAPSGLALLAGSTLQLDLALNPLDGSVAEREVGATLNGEVVPIVAVDDRFRLERRIVEAGELILRLRDRYAEGDGATREIAADPAPTIPIRVLPDRAPFVRVAGPNRNEAVTPQAQLPLSVSATDDYGLADLELEGRVIGEDGAGGDEAGEVLAAWPEVAGVRGETRRQLELRVGDHAAIGEQLVLMATARDANDVTGPGIGRSDPLTLRVVSREQLRQELDRVLGEIRDRVVQSRDQLAPGLNEPERLTGAARGSRPVAERAAEQLADVARRWRANALDATDGEVLARALAAIEDEAVPNLREAAAQENVERALAADAALGEAERAITRLLRSDDLARELSNLRTRQGQLSDATRALLKARLAQGIGDAELDQRLKEFARRQREIADQLREWTQRLLGEDDEKLAEAQSLARGAQPAAALERAAKGLQDGEGGQRALGDQSQAEATMDELLDMLRGDEADGELADLAGELAARQERLQAMLEAGAAPAQLAEAQERLSEETEAFKQRLETESENQEAQESVAGARDAQGEAEEALAQGDSSSAAREAAAAAAQLREAQRSLSPDDEGGDQEQADQEEQNPVTDVLALLKRLHREQTTIVTKTSALVEDGVGVDAELEFGDRRKVAAIAEREEAVLLELQAEALEAVQQMPIVVRALRRVETAVEAAFDHYSRPALGQRGERLAKIALYEIGRLLEIVDSMPSPDESKSGNQQGQNPGGASQAPFPPAAQLALLAAEQSDLRRRTAARYPADLAQQQAELLDLTVMVGQMTRPGSRPNVLMQRAVRAMASATDLLEHDQLGPTTRSEQDLAVDMIHRLLKEAEGSGGGQGGGSSSSGQQRPQQGQSKPKPGDSGDQQGESEGASQGGNASGGEAGEGEGSTTVEVGVAHAEWMHLPPQAREQLQEAFEDNVPPEALDLYRSYLEQLEGARE